MGNLVSLLGNALKTPITALFGASCEGVCEGTWDVVCFVENVCVASLVKLCMMVAVAVALLSFVHLVYKTGILQCLVKDACGACSASCRALGAAWCCLWRRVRDTKRVYRGRRAAVARGHRGGDVEGGVLSDSDSSCYSEDTSSSSSSSDDDGRGRYGSDGRRGFRTSRARGGPSPMERRKDLPRQSLRPRRLPSKKERAAAAARSHGSGRHQHHRRAGGAEERAQVSSPPPPHIHVSPRRDHNHAHAH